MEIPKEGIRCIEMEGLCVQRVPCRKYCARTVIPAGLEQPPLPGMQAPAERKFHNAGKQVLYNNTHYADAKDEGAAEFICHVLNAAVE